MKLSSFFFKKCLKYTYFYVLRKSLNSFKKALKALRKAYKFSEKLLKFSKILLKLSKKLSKLPDCFAESLKLAVSNFFQALLR